MPVLDPNQEIKPTEVNPVVKPAATQAVTPLDTGKLPSAPVQPTAIGQGLVGNQQDTAGKTALDNTYGISQSTATNAADKLSQVAGYNATEAIFDPSRKVELQSLIGKYQDQQKAAGAATSVPAVGGQPGVAGNATTGTPAAATTPSNLPEQTNVAKTGIASVDSEIAKNQAIRDNAVKDTENSYLLNQGNFQNQKNNFSNFDQVNATFQGVMSDRRAALLSSPDGNISAQQAQQIAQKYGVTPESVLNPNKVWDSLSVTAQGGQNLGTTAFDNSMANMKTNLDRQSADIQTNLKNQSQQYQNQIDDVKRQLDQNVGFMQAQGAWNGASRSTGYQQGIQNVKDEGNRTIDKLEQMRTQLETASATDLSRLTEDYGKAVSQAKAQFDTQFSQIKQQTGNMLAGAAEQYGIGNDQLTKALTDIENSFHTQTLDTMSKYLANVHSVNSIANDNADQLMKKTTFMQGLQKETVQGYLANNGAGLANATTNTLAQQVQDGKISMDQALQLRSTMLDSVTQTLQKGGATVNAADQSTIEHMLATGSTPAQIVSAMRGNDKFALSAAPKLEKDANGNQVAWNPNTGRYEGVTDQNANGLDSSSVTTDTKTGVVSFTPEADKALRSAGVNTSLLSLPNGSQRSGRDNVNQCGAYVNDVLGTPSLFGDSLDDKPVNSQTPAIGSAIVMDIKDANGKSLNPNGHVGIVIGINGSVLTVKDSNYKGDGTIGTHFLDLNNLTSPNGNTVDVKGYYATPGVATDTKGGSIDSVAKQVAEYRIDPSKLSVYRKTPEVWAQILQKAQEINPDFSDSDYAKNNASVKAYGPAGKIGLSLKSLDTVIGHLGSYLDAVNKYNSNLQIVGKLENMVTNPTGGLLGGTALSTLNPIAHNIGDETAKFFGGGTSSAGDREKRAAEVDVNATPNQAKEFVKTQIDQLASQTKAWNDQYKNATGKYNPDIMTNEAKQKVLALSEKYGLGIKISDITGNEADDQAGSTLPASLPSGKDYSKYE